MSADPSAPPVEQVEPPVEPQVEPRRSNRLVIEQRVLGLLGVLGLSHLLLGILWAGLFLDGEQIAGLAGDPRGPLLLALPLVATALILAHVLLRLPAARWSPNRASRSPSPWPLALAGAPSLLFWPFLIGRDRQARRRPLDGDEVELGFRELLTIPRLTAISSLAWLGLASLIDGGVLAQTFDLAPRTTAMFLSLWLGSLLPLATLAIGRVRAMLVPEYLSAPRPNPTALPLQRSLRLRLGAPAAMALAAAVIVPALAGAAWTERLQTIETRERVTADTAVLEHLVAVGDIDGIEALRARYPEAQIGTDPPRITLPAREVPATPASLLLTIIALGLSAGALSLMLLLRDVDRDLGRASRQVGSVADGDIPEPMAVETFATRELRELVAAVDRLVGRITDANVAKYVLIEKGQEADRLKGQFLANMSHDLRSPLNSVIGFSELLTTGIEGEITDEQRAMVVAIHQAGRGLLQQIDDILDTAKIEAGHMELHPEPTPPATLIARAIERARPHLDPQIDIETSFGAGLPPAFADPYRTAQALENVLRFAAEGLSRDQISLTCAASRSPDDGNHDIVIRVVSPRALDSLEALEQAQRGFVRVAGQSGLGLGLPIATSIFELQGGSLRVEADPERTKDQVGLRVEIHLPALVARRGLRLKVR